MGEEVIRHPVLGSGGRLLLATRIERRAAVDGP